MIVKDGREIITGIKAGYVVIFDPGKKTISFFKDKRLHPLYFELGTMETDNRFMIDFLKNPSDIVRFLIFQADIEHLTLKPFEHQGKNPAWIFCKRRGRKIPKSGKTGRARGSNDSLLEPL